MSPISAFRPYFGPIERIICCPTQQSASRILQNELHSTANVHPSLSSDENATIPTIVSSRPSKKRSFVLEKSRSMLKVIGDQQKVGSSTGVGAGP